MISSRPTRTAASTLALIAACTAPSAFAADLGGAPPPPVIYDDTRPALLWQGLYVGANIGFDRSRDHVRETSATPYNGLDFERARAHSNGFTGGGQIGYNAQFGNIVVGVEADINGVDGGRSGTSRTGAVSVDTQQDYLGTVRARLGYAAGPWLFYGTGGLAYGDVTTTVTGNTFNPLSTSTSETKVGWAAGAGIEYAMSRNWTIRTEYLHTDLGRTDLTTTGLDGNTYTWRDRTTSDAVRFGLNYKF